MEMTDEWSHPWLVADIEKESNNKPPMSQSHEQHPLVADYYPLFHVREQPRDPTFTGYLGLEGLEISDDLHKASDIAVEAVKTSLRFNLAVFVLLMASYELLRRLVPSVYARKGKEEEEEMEEGSQQRISAETGHVRRGSGYPLDWVLPVYHVSWPRVLETAGPDAYMFLRYVRLCLRITSVSAFWSLLLLCPVYATGHGGYNATTWYHYTMANLAQKSWRMWIPTGFIYLLSAYIFYVMEQEYTHYKQLRTDFLAKGLRPQSASACITSTSTSTSTTPTTSLHHRHHHQHAYSIVVDNIPPDLRSDKALYDYFNRLFPQKVHSATVVMNVSDLQTTHTTVHNLTRALEKTIAYYYATGRRPTHIVQRRCNLTNIFTGTDCSLLDLLSCGLGRCCRTTFDYDALVDDQIEEDPILPPPGSIVDSVTYYSRTLAHTNEDLIQEQRIKARIGEVGNQSIRAENWIDFLTDYARAVDSTIQEESLMANALVLPPPQGKSLLLLNDKKTRRADDIQSSPILDLDTHVQLSAMMNTNFDGDVDKRYVDNERRYGSLDNQHMHKIWNNENVNNNDNDNDNDTASSNTTNPGHEPILEEDHSQSQTTWSLCKRLAVRLGFDFFVSLLHKTSKQAKAAIDTVVGTSISDSGFVTFYTHEAATVATCTPLTHTFHALEVEMAPESRDILWENVNVSKDTRRRKEISANVLLGIGLVLWSIPLTAIQAFAKAEQLVRVPGMKWMVNFDGGRFVSLINGYLPVILLLALINLLPIVFEAVATSYENRRTRSDIQISIVGRYFYYQVANIYITVTAGTIWRALADILDHPAEILNILGTSIPMMVGYFLSLLITKILAGLPMVILRAGALSRMTLFRICFNNAKLTQRELDEVYRNENVNYGWEYPSLLLVIMICFAYSCIAPVILPVGALYFFGVSLVYKQQVLYVYTATYESGGKMFPFVCDRTLFGLIISQLTFIGYSLIRGGHYQPLVLFPLPLYTMHMMRHFRTHYAEPSLRLSLERAIELDFIADMKTAGAQTSSGYNPNASVKKLVESFSSDYYRQPVLTVTRGSPLPYRRADGMDELTASVLNELDGA